MTSNPCDTCHKRLPCDCEDSRGYSGLGPICVHCGKLNEEVSDLDESKRTSSWECKCQYCKRVFLIIREVTVNWETKKVGVNL